jgi:hypothetical protein
MRFSTTLIAAIATKMVTAHGDHDLNQEMAVRNAMLQHTSRSVEHCAAQMKTRGLEARAAERRVKTRDQLIKKRGLKGI